MTGGAARPPCLDDPGACQPGDCWCARWAGTAEPLPELDDEPAPAPPARPIRDVPTRGLL